jgi:hypothetical protein
MTNFEKPVENSFRGREVADFADFHRRRLWLGSYTAPAL